MLIETGNLNQKALQNQVAIVTGSGRGIGYEAARSLLWLGAKVVIAEINKETGRAAEKQLKKEFGEDTTIFIQTDIGNERDVWNLKKQIDKRFQKVDIVINNATITPMGAVKDVAIKRWDASYGVNLRGPVLLTKAFLPGMLERDYGVVMLVSSVGEAYMGAYESFKAAQIHLGNTLDAELEGTHVYALTIGPGLVRTEGANEGIRQLAPLYGKTEEEFYALSEDHIITVESAGAGYAAAVVLASQFRGQEIGAKQALIAAGIYLEEERKEKSEIELSKEEIIDAIKYCEKIQSTFKEQVEGWSERSLFERQWMFRDFKKHGGMTVEQMIVKLTDLLSTLERRDLSRIAEVSTSLGQLDEYYKHMEKLASGYEKNLDRLTEQLNIIQEWQDEIKKLKNILKQ